MLNTRPNLNTSYRLLSGGWQVLSILLTEFTCFKLLIASLLEGGRDLFPTTVKLLILFPPNMQWASVGPESTISLMCFLQVVEIITRAYGGSF